MLLRTRAVIVLLLYPHAVLVFLLCPHAVLVFLLLSYSSCNAAVSSCSSCNAIQICKRRVRVLNARSPAQGMVGVVTPQKAYKHVAWLNLSHIKRVVDVRETAGACG